MVEVTTGSYGWDGGKITRPSAPRLRARLTPTCTQSCVRMPVSPARAAVPTGQLPALTTFNSLKHYTIAIYVEWTLPCLCKHVGLSLATYL